MAPPDRPHASLILLGCPSDGCGARQVRLVVRMKVRATLPRASQVDSKEHQT